MAMQMLWNVEKELKAKEWVFTSRASMRRVTTSAALCGPTLCEFCLKKEDAQQMKKGLGEEVERWDIGTQTSLSVVAKHVWKGGEEGPGDRNSRRNT